MRKILADAAPFAKHLIGGCADIRHFSVKAKVVVNARGQVEKSIQQRTLRRKRLKCIGCKFRACLDSRRFETELIGFQSSGALIAGKKPRGLFPRKRAPRRRCCIAIHSYLTPGFHHQFLMRFLHGEEVEQVSEIVHSLGDRCRGWMDVKFALDEMLARYKPRPQASHMLPNGDRMAVIARSSMNDSVDHKPTVIGKVRAWLKYRLDRLFDHEGSSSSSPLRKRSRRARPLAAFAASVPPGSG